jgi:hypothetical protein
VKRPSRTNMFVGQSGPQNFCNNALTNWDVPLKKSLTVVINIFNVLIWLEMTRFREKSRHVVQHQ